MLDRENRQNHGTAKQIPVQIRAPLPIFTLIDALAGNGNLATSPAHVAFGVCVHALANTQIPNVKILANLGYG